ncbi:Uncharacterised protein [uncultured archaeon]|nr:Uncharacterised protein [uncultured archaeon]
MGFLGNVNATAKLQNAVRKFGPNSEEAKSAYDECVKLDEKYAEQNAKPFLEKALEKANKKAIDEAEKKRIAEMPEEQKIAEESLKKAEGIQNRIKDIENEMDKGKLIFNTKDNIEELCNKNMFSLMDIQTQEAGSSWSKLGSMLSMDSGTQLMAAMLKANSDENKIMIRQNEIIIRLLTQMAGESKAP